MDSLVPESTLEEIEEARAGSSSEFLVLTYDFPTENASWDDLVEEDQAELASELKSIRQSLQQSFAMKGVQLSQSTYIVRAEYVASLINTVDSKYAGLDYGISDQITTAVEIHIVGSSYEHVVRDIIVETLEDAIEEMSRSLEKADQMVKNDMFEDQSDRESTRRKLWSMSSRLDRLENRTEDLGVIDEQLGQQYAESVRSLASYRQNILDSDVLNGG